MAPMTMATTTARRTRAAAAPPPIIAQSGQLLPRRAFAGADPARFWKSLPAAGGPVDDADAGWPGAAAFEDGKDLDCDFVSGTRVSIVGTSSSLPPRAFPARRPVPA